MKEQVIRAISASIFWLLLSTLMVCPIQAQDILWIRTYDNGHNLHDHGRDVTTDGSGNIIVTGSTYGGVGDQDDWLTIKYNSDGDTLWVRTYDVSWLDHAYSVVADPWDNIIVTGYVLGGYENIDYAIVKYDTNGNILWRESYDSTYADEAKSVATDSWGNIIVTGSISEGLGDYCTIKYDPDGQILWERFYDGGFYDVAQDVAIDPWNNIIVTGFSDRNINWNWCTVKYSPDGDTLWIREVDIGTDDWAFGVAVDQGGNVIVAGDVDIGGGHNRAYAIKYNSNGDTLWRRIYDDIGRFHEVATDIWDNIIFITAYYGEGTNYDYYTIKCNTEGDTLWTAIYDGGYGDGASGVATDIYGNVIVTGSMGTAFPGCTNPDYLTIKYGGTSGVDELLDPAVPEGFELFQNYPNPFNAETVIGYTLPFRHIREVSLKVYNISGREIKTLVQTPQSSGAYEVVWDGRNNQGKAVSSGIYFVQLEVDTFAHIKKMILLR